LERNEEMITINVPETYTRADRHEDNITAFYENGWYSSAHILHIWQLANDAFTAMGSSQIRFCYQYMLTPQSDYLFGLVRMINALPAGIRYIYFLGMIDGNHFTTYRVDLVEKRVYVCDALYEWRTKHEQHRAMVAQIGSALMIQRDPEFPLNIPVTQVGDNVQQRQPDSHSCGVLAAQLAVSSVNNNHSIRAISGDFFSEENLMRIRIEHLGMWRHCAWPPRVGVNVRFTTDADRPAEERPEPEEVDALLAPFLDYRPFRHEVGDEVVVPAAERAAAAGLALPAAFVAEQERLRREAEGRQQEEADAAIDHRKAAAEAAERRKLAARAFAMVLPEEPKASVQPEVPSRTCVACLFDFERGDKALKLDCKHEYHRQCLFNWAQEKRVSGDYTCSNCVKPFNGDAVLMEDSYEVFSPNALEEESLSSESSHYEIPMEDIAQLEQHEEEEEKVPQQQEMSPPFNAEEPIIFNGGFF
jgi:hypothetical protein